MKIVKHDRTEIARKVSETIVASKISIKRMMNVEAKNTKIP
jgi:hypothetical protein